VYEFWYAIKWATRTIVPSSDITPLCLMEVVAVWTEIGKVNSISPRGVESIESRWNFKSFLRERIRGWQYEFFLPRCFFSKLLFQVCELFIALTVHLEGKWKMTIKLVDSYAGIKSIPDQTAPSGSPCSGSWKWMSGILSSAMYKLTIIKLDKYTKNKQFLRQV
jgi:hypothetical protein